MKAISRQFQSLPVFVRAMAAAALAAILLLPLTQSIVMANTNPPPIVVIHNDEQLELNTPPYAKNGTTLVPMRPIFEALGISLRWDAATQTVHGSKTGLVFSLKLGSKQATVNGKSVPLTEAAAARNGSTLVPLRFIGEASGALVLWNPYMNAVHTYDAAYMEKIGLSKQELQQRFNDYLAKAKEEYEKNKPKTTPKPDNGKPGDGKPGDGKDNQRLCSVWRYHPVYGGSLEWQPCP